MRYFAAEVLLQQRGRDAIEVVANALNERLIHLQQSILDKLAKLGMEDPRAFDVLREIIENDALRGRDYALQSLWSIRDPRVIPLTPEVQNLSPKEAKRVVCASSGYILPDPDVSVLYRKAVVLLTYLMEEEYERNGIVDMLLTYSPHTRFVAYWESKEQYYPEGLTIYLRYGIGNLITSLVGTAEKLKQSFRLYFEGEWRYPGAV